MNLRGLSVLWAPGSLGLCVALTRSAGAAIVESDETAWELFNWTAAAGPVDHFMPAEGVADPVPNDFDGDAIPDLLVHDTVAGEVRVTLSTSPEPVPVWRDVQSGACELWRMSGGDLVAPPE